MGKNIKLKSNAASLLGKLGGRAVLKKYGKEYFTKLVQKRWKKAKSKKNFA